MRRGFVVLFFFCVLCLSCCSVAQQRTSHQSDRWKQLFGAVEVEDDLGRPPIKSCLQQGGLGFRGHAFKIGRVSFGVAVASSLAFLGLFILVSRLRPAIGADSLVNG